MGEKKQKVVTLINVCLVLSTMIHEPCKNTLKLHADKYYLLDSRQQVVVRSVFVILSSINQSSETTSDIRISLQALHPPLPENAKSCKVGKKWMILHEVIRLSCDVFKRIRNSCFQRLVRDGTNVCRCVSMYWIGADNIWNGRYYTFWSLDLPWTEKKGISFYLIYSDWFTL